MSPHPNQEPTNSAISRLAREAVHELDRVASVGGLQQDDIKHAVWSILGSLRSIVREQLQRSGPQIKKSEEVTQASPMDITKAIRLNDSIVSIALNAKESLQKLDDQLTVANTRPILTGMLGFYRRILDSEAHLVNSVHLSTMLHRTAITSRMAKQQPWVMQAYQRLLEDIFLLMEKRWNQMNAGTFSIIIWSLGRLGSQIRTIAVGDHSFDRFFQNLLENTSPHFSRMSAHELINIVAGCASVGVSRLVLGPFLQSFAHFLLPKIEEFKPEDFSYVVSAFHQLQFEQGHELVKRVSEVAEQRMEEFSNPELFRFLKALAQSQIALPSSFTEKTDQVLNARLENINLGQLLFESLLEQMCKRMEEGLRDGTAQSRNVCDFLVTCVHLDIKPEAAIRACKRQFVKTSFQYPPIAVSRVLNALSLMDELDEPIMETVDKTQLATANPIHLTLEHRRQICQMLMSMRVLHSKVLHLAYLPQSDKALYKQEAALFVSREVEEVCFAAMRSSLRNKGGSYGMAKEVLSILGASGFQCQPSWTIDKVPINLSSAVLPAAVSGLEKDMNFAVEIITKAHVFSNNEAVMSPSSRLRQRILRILGWSVLGIKTHDWNQQESQQNKAKLLYDLVKNETGYESAQLLDYDQVKNQHVELVQKATEQDRLEDKPTAHSDMQAMIRGEEKAKIKTEDLIPLPSAADDSQFSGIVLNSPSDTSASGDKTTAAQSDSSEDEDTLTDDSSDSDAESEKNVISDLFPDNEGPDLEDEAFHQDDAESMTVSESDSEEEAELATAMDDSEIEFEDEDLSEDSQSSNLPPNDSPNVSLDSGAEAESQEAGLFSSDVEFETLLRDTDASESRGRQRRGKH